MENYSKWMPIEKVDSMKRKPNEWAKIYHMQLFGDIPNRLWSEYEWAYNLSDLQRCLLPDKNDDFEQAGLMELRADELRRDLFMGADIGEKEVLKEKYIETEWIRMKLLTI